MQALNIFKPFHIYSPPKIFLQALPLHMDSISVSHQTKLPFASYQQVSFTF